MKIIYKRATKRIKRLKFKCLRCGCKFLANLNPDCSYDYAEYIERNSPDSQPVFIQGFVNIKSTCPECKKVIEYDQKIDLFRDDRRVK